MSDRLWGEGSRGVDLESEILDKLELLRDESSSASDLADDLEEALESSRPLPYEIETQEEFAQYSNNEPLRQELVDLWKRLDESWRPSGVISALDRARAILGPDLGHRLTNDFYLQKQPPNPVAFDILSQKHRELANYLLDQWGDDQFRGGMKPIIQRMEQIPGLREHVPDLRTSLLAGDLVPDTNVMQHIESLDLYLGFLIRSKWPREPRLPEGAVYRDPSVRARDQIHPYNPDLADRVYEEVIPNRPIPMDLEVALRQFDPNLLGALRARVSVPPNPSLRIVDQIRQYDRALADRVYESVISNQPLPEDVVEDLRQFDPNLLDALQMRASGPQDGVYFTVEWRRRARENAPHESHENIEYDWVGRWVDTKGYDARPLSYLLEGGPVNTGSRPDSRIFISNDQLSRLQKKTSSRRRQKLPSPRINLRRI